MPPRVGVRVTGRLASKHVGSNARNFIDEEDVPEILCHCACNRTPKLTPTKVHRHAACQPEAFIFVCCCNLWVQHQPANKSDFVNSHVGETRSRHMDLHHMAEQLCRVIGRSVCCKLSLKGEVCMIVNICIKFLLGRSARADNWT